MSLPTKPGPAAHTCLGLQTGAYKLAGANSRCTVVTGPEAPLSLALGQGDPISIQGRLSYGAP